MQRLAIRFPNKAYSTVRMYLHSRIRWKTASKVNGLSSDGIDRINPLSAEEGCAVMIGKRRLLKEGKPLLTRFRMFLLSRVFIYTSPHSFHGEYRREIAEGPRSVDDRQSPTNAASLPMRGLSVGCI